MLSFQFSCRYKIVRYSIVCTLSEKPVHLFPLLQCYVFLLWKQIFLPQLPLQIRACYTKLFSAIKYKQL